MSLAKLNLDEETLLEFSMQISGGPDGDVPPQARFLIEGKRFNIVCQCEQSGDEIAVKVPKLKNIFEAGAYDAHLEVILDGRIFTPFSDTVEFIAPVSLAVKPTKAQAVADTIVVTAKESTSEPAPTRIKITPPVSALEKNIQEAQKQGFTVEKVGNYQILRRNNKYAGIVTEAGVLKSQGRFDTVKDLIRNLSEEIQFLKDTSKSK